jgi:outer membrane protein assembly factor BamB
MRTVRAVGILSVMLIGASVALTACGGPGLSPSAAVPSAAVAPSAVAPSAAVPSAAVAPSAAVSSSGVPTYRGNAGRTGAMPGPGPSGTPKVAWQFQAAGPFGSSPVVAAGVVYALSGDGIVHALSLSTGKELWKADLGAQASASPLLVGPDLIVADEAGAVHALATATGTAHWTTPTDGPISGSPAANGTRLIAATQSGTVYAIDAATGAVAWHAAAGGPVSRSVAIADDVAYLGLERKIVAMSVEDGKIRWGTDVASDGVIGTPAISGGLVYAATGIDADDATAHGVVALDAATGAKRWTYVSPEGQLIYTPAIVDGHAYVVGHDRHVVSLDAATGAVQWSVDRPSDVEALPAVSGGVVYVAGNDGPAAALDAKNGSELWTVAILGVPYAPAVVDGYLLVGTDADILYAIGGPT